MCIHHKEVEGVPALMSALGPAVQDTAVQHMFLLETLDAAQVCVILRLLKHQGSIVHTNDVCTGLAFAQCTLICLIEGLNYNKCCQLNSCVMANNMTTVSHSCAMLPMCQQSHMLL